LWVMLMCEARNLTVSWLWRIAFTTLFVAVSVSAARAADDDPPPRLAVVRDSGDSYSKIEYGLPPGEGGGSRCRVGAWMPVYVRLVAGNEDIGAGQYSLVVEAKDSDDIQSQYIIPVPQIDKNTERTVITYARPGTIESGIKVTIKAGPGVKDVPQPKNPVLQGVLEPKQICYVTLGPRLPRMTRALQPQGPQGPQAENKEQYRFAQLDTVDQMPDRWFGYAAADVIYLASGSQFIKELHGKIRSGEANPGESLAEWVRRGGKLVITAGRNFETVSAVLKALRLMDCELGAPTQVTNIREVGAWTQTPFEAIQSLEVTALKPGPGVQTLIAHKPALSKDKDKVMPLMLMAPCGLGRVVLIGFDVEIDSFTNWKGHDGFWRTLNEQLKPKVNFTTNASNMGGMNAYGTPSNEIGKPFQQSLETFEEVPVISFGWVALFIFIYILIVGPLDYFFLKKVVKRLELTWITFPLVVLIISVAAYFIAYQVKGNDLRINKTDVVDIDLEQDQVYGTTYFTLFSPRIQNYTIGVEPSEEWAKQPGDYGAVVTSLSPPDENMGGMNRSGSQSLFTRSYEYAPGAEGLKGVPIPVWASRSFTGSWHAPIRQGNELIKHDIQINREQTYLTGTITSKLPVELSEVGLFYRGRWYPLGTAQKPERLTPNQPLRIDTLNLSTKPTPGGEFLKESFQQFRRDPSSEKKQNAWGQYEAPGTTGRVEEMMKTILFYSADSTNPKFSGMNNSNFRGLDQGWRLKPRRTVIGSDVSDRYLDEVILVGRVTAPSASAEDVNIGGASATRLWLGKLPGGQEARPTLVGKMSQDTYVRIFIPVQPSEK